MIDRALIGQQLAEFVFAVEAFQLRLFAKAIGECRPEYIDATAAKAAGFRSILAPPTFCYAITLNPANPLDVPAFLGVDVKDTLHGEQAFSYQRPICAGDQVRVKRRVTDIYSRKAGALEFAVVESELSDAGSGVIYASTMTTLAIRRPECAP